MICKETATTVYPDIDFYYQQNLLQLGYNMGYTL